VAAVQTAGREAAYGAPEPVSRRSGRGERKKKKRSPPSRKMVGLTTVD
jgi:hypothetical protein